MKTKISIRLSDTTLASLKEIAGQGDLSRYINDILDSYLEGHNPESQPIADENKPTKVTAKPISAQTLAEYETKEQRIARMAENQRIAKERNKNRLLTFTAKPKKES